MKENEDYYYKTIDFNFASKKEELKKNVDNEYGYNFDCIKRRVIKEDYSKEN